jgi:AcrR family transcriptional regulator
MISLIPGDEPGKVGPFHRPALTVRGDPAMSPTPPVAAPSPAATAAPGGPTRERILAAATHEFAARGYDGARIDAIGRAAGVNKALLYYYFPNKGELYRGLVLEQIAAIGRRLAAAEQDELPAPETLTRMIEAIVDLGAERPAVPLLVLREVLNGWGHLRDEDFPALFATARPIADTVARGVAAGAFRPVPPLYAHLLIMGAMNFFLVSAPARARGSRLVGQPDMDPDPRAFARFVSDLVTRGLAADPAAPSRIPHPGATA